MSLSAEKSAPAALWNVPNALTTARLVLSIVVFVLIALEQWVAAAVVFVIAASTDWVDGYWARKYNLVTKFGRIFDPFVDKTIICGAFIMLAAVPGSGAEAWMAVVVVARELLVTALRGHVESGGGDFSAKWAGKLKMTFQCVAVVVSLIFLAVRSQQGAVPPWLEWSLLISMWVAVISTVHSAVGYVKAAASGLR